MITAATPDRIRTGAHLIFCSAFRPGSLEHVGAITRIATHSLYVGNRRISRHDALFVADSAQEASAFVQDDRIAVDALYAQFERRLVTHAKMRMKKVEHAKSGNE
jgi:hypothetical protein